jgi:hypothetical protein
VEDQEFYDGVLSIIVGMREALSHLERAVRDHALMGAPMPVVQLRILPPPDPSLERERRPG